MVFSLLYCSCLFVNWFTCVCAYRVFGNGRFVELFVCFCLRAVVCSFVSSCCWFVLQVLCGFLPHLLCGFLPHLLCGFLPHLLCGFLPHLLCGFFATLLCGFICCISPSLKCFVMVDHVNSFLQNNIVPACSCLFLLAAVSGGVVVVLCNILCNC